MTKTTTNAASKSLVFKAMKTRNNMNIFVEISLADECRNGHQEFHITADLYVAGKPKTDKYWIGSGCQHEEIKKAFPEFAPFIRLHDCDWEGVPTHAAANGFYFLRNGFNTTKPEDAEFKAEFCEYYRITPEQFDALNESRNKLQYALKLQSLGILAQWKEEANKAIAYLQELTETEFVVDSPKSQFDAPTPEQIAEEENRIASGYYTPEAEAEREKAKQAKILAKLEAERDKDIKKATTEFEVKKQVLLIGGEKALNNCIFYNHSNTLSFNWRSYDMISSELVSKIIAEAVFPEGVKVENKNGKD